jgi:hypothetical protein
MSDFVVAIPSYERADILRTHTLELLRVAHISNERIYIFIADIPDNSQEQKYSCYRNEGYNVIKGPLGLQHMRNFIHKYFKEGQPILCIDDDIQHIVEMVENTSIQDVKSAKRYPLSVIDSHLKTWIEKAFKYLEESNTSLFGIYPVKNGYFMKSLPSVTTDLKFCVGAFWGMINRQDCQIQLEEKEDFERTLWCYQRDGKVVRWNHIAPVTNYYKTKGGMQATGRDRVKAAKESCTVLLSMYPKWCKLYTSKKSGIHEVRLRG